MELQAETWEDSGTVALSDGENIALRRNRLGWKQRLLAEKAGVSLATVLKIEKDRNVRVDMLRAVEGALAREEAARGGGTTLSPPSGTTEPSMKEGAADVLAAIQETRHKLDNHLTLLLGAVEGIRRDMADLDARAQAAQSARKPA